MGRRRATADSSPPIPDPSSAPSMSISMPIPDINVQLPRAGTRETPYVYEQPYASEYPYASEPPYAPEPPYTPEYPYPFQQPYHVPPHVLVSPYHTELQNDAWVPRVPEQSDEADFDPTSEPLCIPTPQPVQTVASVSRKPSRLERFASFVGLRHKESTTSRHS